MTSIAIDKSGDLCLTIPSETGKAHTVVIPLSLDGLRLIKKTLVARQKEIARIGMPGSPTQEMCNAWLSAKAAADQAKSTGQAKEALHAVEEKYGINLNELELDF